MQIVKDKISLAELIDMSQKMFGGLVKAVVDIEQGIMAVDAELHVDLEELLLENGCQQGSLWGINIHPQKAGTQELIEFDSMINIRPAVGNRSRYVEDAGTRQKITLIVDQLVAQ